MKDEAKLGQPSRHPGWLITEEDYVTLEFFCMLIWKVFLLREPLFVPPIFRTYHCGPLAVLWWVEFQLTSRSCYKWSLSAANRFCRYRLCSWKQETNDCGVLWSSTTCSFGTGTVGSNACETEEEGDLYIDNSAWYSEVWLGQQSMEAKKVMEHWEVERKDGKLKMKHWGGCFLQYISVRLALVQANMSMES